MKRYDYLFNGSAVIFTALQTEQVFQIISLVLTCLSILVSLFFSIWGWYKKAKQDGEISAKEIKEANKIMQSHTKDLKDSLTKKDE